MKMIYTLAALAFIATTAQAAKPSCWASQGNWQNAASTSCAFASGGGMTPKEVVHKKPSCDHEGDDETDAPKV